VRARERKEDRNQQQQLTPMPDAPIPDPIQPGAARVSTQ